MNYSDLPLLRRGADRGASLKPVGAENCATASAQRIHGEPTFAPTAGGPRSMIPGEMIRPR